MRQSKRYLLALVAIIFIITSTILLISSLINNTNPYLQRQNNKYYGGANQLPSDVSNQVSSSSRHHLVNETRNIFDLYWKQVKREDKDDFSESSMKSLEQIRSQNAQNLIYVATSEQNNDPSQHLLDYIKFPSSLTSYDFSKCRMSNCFDYSRCLDGPMKVHIVPIWKEGGIKEESVNSTFSESSQIHKNILEVIRASKYFEPDPEKACLFILADDTLDRDPLSQGFRSDIPSIFGPNNLYGMNYLVFNLYSGSWPDYKENDFAGLQIGAAILAKASNSIENHRPGFDISLPLFSYLHPKSDNIDSKHSDIPIADDNRTYFLTFKGKRYVFGSGSETRNSLYHLNNQRDVIMLTTCRHGKKWRESVDSRCSDDEAIYDQYDFVELIKESKFCLTPRGRRLGSFRFLEALSFGCIPVILSNGWVNPFDEIIDWSGTTVQFDESLLSLVPDMLRDLDEQTISKMRKNCRFLYAKYFSSVEKIILTTLSIIEQRIQNTIKVENMTHL